MQQIQRFLTELELSDRKLSQLLCKMRNLADSKVNRTLWLQRLSLNMCSILTFSNDNLPELATIADQIWELKSSSYQIASISISANTSRNVLETMQHQIAELSSQISALSHSNYGSPCQ